MDFAKYPFDEEKKVFTNWYMQQALGTAVCLNMIKQGINWPIGPYKYGSNFQKCNLPKYVTD